MPVGGRRTKEEERRRSVIGACLHRSDPALLDGGAVLAKDQVAGELDEVCETINGQVPAKYASETWSKHHLKDILVIDLGVHKVLLDLLAT
jgi:hypothetical protein